MFSRFAVISTISPANASSRSSSHDAIPRLVDQVEWYDPSPDAGEPPKLS